MPILLLLLAVPLLLVLAVALMPVGVVVRYRRGTSRQRARSWVASFNVVGIATSVAVLLATAALATFWAPRSVPAVALGLCIGGALGLLGLRLSRWELDDGRLHHTPNRWLGLVLALLVAGRIAWNMVRAWHLRGGVEGETWLAAVGAAESMGVAGIFLGHALVYWLGVRRRARTWT